MKIKRFKQGFKIRDFFGLGVFLVVMASVFFFFLRKAAYVDIILRISQSDLIDSYYGLPVWYFQNLKTGTEQKDLLGRPVISILKNYEYQTQNSSVRIVYLTMRLLATYDQRSKMYTYEGTPLLVGSYQSFKFNGVLIKGIIQGVEDSGKSQGSKKYLVEGFLNPEFNLNQDPYAANTLSDGVLNYLADKFVKGEKVMDSDGNVIMEIQDVQKTRAKRKFIYNNSLVEVNDSERQKVSLKLVVRTEKFGDVYIFRGEKPLKINDNLNLSFDDFGAVMTITGIREL